MNKKISLLLCIALCALCCLTVFAGCAQLPTLDNQTEQKILQFYAKDAVAPFGAKDYRIRNYYGNYNGAEVFILDDYTPRYNHQGDLKVVIDGLTFDTTNDQLISVLYNDTNYTLAQAYEQKVLTKEHLQQVHKLFGKFGENYADGKHIKAPTLPHSVADKLDGCLGYFGSYNGIHVYYTSGSGLDVVTSTQIGDRNVYIDNSFALKAYYQGQVVAFQQVADKLTSAQLQSLYNVIMCVGFDY